MWLFVETLSVWSRAFVDGSKENVVSEERIERVFLIHFGIWKREDGDWPCCLLCAITHTSA